MVTLLTFADGRPFATGATAFLYQPATPDETTARILMPLEVERVPTVAVLDTGTPYLICVPHLAVHLSLGPQTALEQKTILIRGSWVVGYLHRLTVGFLAEQGDHISVDATVFVPDPDWEEWWGELPSFIGLGGCLERIRFAIDPGRDMFYFGPL